MADPYYVPPHLSDPFTKDEMKAYVDVYKTHDAADGDADGFIEVDALPHLMAAIGEKHTAAKEAELVSECDPNGTGDLGFLDVLRLMARFRYRRDPFGGKRAITDDLPLPVRVATEYDKPCIQHPDRRAQMADPTDPTVTVMRMIFNRHDADGSGEIEMHEVVDILADHGLVFDEEELESTFHRFDVDRGGTLDFGEFCEMMADLKAETAIVEARGVSYDVPPALMQHFSSEELADLKVNFGMFDVDGGGSIAASEIKAVLDDMGLNPTEEQVLEVIAEVDRDGSGEIEFGEFVELMHKVNTGQVEMGVLAQAVLDSAASQKMGKEVRAINECIERGGPEEKEEEEGDGDGGAGKYLDAVLSISSTSTNDNDEEEEEDEDHGDDVRGGRSDSNQEGAVVVGKVAEDEDGDGDEEEEEEEDLGSWVEGLVSIDVSRKDSTTCHARIRGPPHTPYAGTLLSLEVKVGDDYPYAPPVRVAFTHRVLHVNFSIALDGTTALPQLLQFWDAEWNIAKLLRYIRELLIEPNLSLLPPDYAEGTRHDPAAAAASQGDRDDDDEWYQDQDGKWHESLYPVVRGTSTDLRRKKGQNRFLAEVVYLFCEQRGRYDAAVKDFAKKYGEAAPRGDGYYD